MEDKEAFYDVVEKICDLYEMDSIYADGATIRGFINQVHFATEGDVDKVQLLNWIEKYGLEYVFDKVIYVFAQGKPYGAYLNKAIRNNWKWNPASFLTGKKPKVEERLNIDEPVLIGDFNVLKRIHGS